MLSTQILIVSLSSISILQDHQYFFFQLLHVYLLRPLQDHPYFIFLQSNIIVIVNNFMVINIIFNCVFVICFNSSVLTVFFTSRVISSSTSSCSSSATSSRLSVFFFFLSKVKYHCQLFYFLPHPLRSSISSFFPE